MATAVSIRKEVQMDAVTYDTVIRVACGVTIYLVIGLLMWLEVKTRNDVSMKVKGRKAWQEPRFFRLIFFWLPAYILGLLPKKWELNRWLYK